MTNQTLNLNLIPGGVDPVINVSQYDKGQTWTINLYSGSQSFSIPSGATVSIRGTKPDKNGFAYDCTYSGNVVTAILQQQMTAVAGKVVTEIVITKNSEMIGSANFVINVEKAALASDTPISDTEIPAIIELAGEQAETAEAWAKGTKNGQAVPSTAEQYHNNAKYWAEQASGSAADALKSEGYAVGKQNGTDVASGSPYYHNNSKYYSEQAASSASTASTKASQASTSATNAANSATSASGSATTATQKAAAASNSATAAANSATAAQQAAASLTVDSALSGSSTNPVQNKIVKGEFDSVKQALSNEVATRAELGAHNLMPMSLADMKAVNTGGTWNGNVYSLYGVDFTVNTDAKGNVISIGVNGTTNHSSTAFILQRSMTLVEGKQYILTGCPSDGATKGYRICELGNAFGTINDYGSGATFTCNSNTTGNMCILINASGTQVSNKVFYPMIRLATDTDPTYQPYAMTNRELTNHKVDYKEITVTTSASGNVNITSYLDGNIPISAYVVGALSLSDLYIVSVIRYSGGYYLHIENTSGTVLASAQVGVRVYCTPSN